jgi:hypothetical protein
MDRERIDRSLAQKRSDEDHYEEKPSKKMKLVPKLVYQGDYEDDRLKRYSDLAENEKNIEYDQKELVASYKEWQKAETYGRDRKWDMYCDIRDGVKIGTNAQIRATPRYTRH